MYLPRLSERFVFSFNLLKTVMKASKLSVFGRKKKNIFISTTLLQLEQRLLPSSYLTLKCKIVFFERYHIQVSFAINFS